ncbi:CBS domain-containing protein [Phytohabitans sp. LJ34]|uniref:CBS domain-containing protein n=1 Tax=Phytohabitans sp. LJ34 TaxID=3452217 RepID=UPI003F8AD861
MRAADVMETLPSVRLDDEFLSVLRMVSQHGWPGLVVVDEHDRVVMCLSSVDLVRLVLPRYLHDGPGLARVFDEEHADRICAVLVDTPVRAVVGEVAKRVPVARPQATVVELAELMARRNCSLVLVEGDDGGTLGVVSANRLLGVVAAATEDRSR